MASFSSGSFSTGSFSVSAFDFGGAVPTTVVGGHYIPDEYKHHRKRLEAAAKAAELFNQSKYVKDAVSIADIAEFIEVDAPEITKVADTIKQNTAMPEIDFSAISMEIDNLLSKMDAIERRKRRQEEEALILILGMI